MIPISFFIVHSFYSQLESSVIVANEAAYIQFTIDNYTLSLPPHQKNKLHTTIAATTHIRSTSSMVDSV